MARNRKATVNDTAPRLLDLRAAASYTGVSAWTLRRLAWNGSLPVVKLPALLDRDRPARRVWFEREALDELIAAGRTRLGGDAA